MGFPRAPTAPLVRGYNRFGRGLTLDADAFLRAAGGELDARVGEGTERLVRALRDAGTLTPFGTRVASSILAGALATRVQVDRTFAAHPELDRVPLRDPLIVFGMQRSGTTFLHRLLAEAPGARSLAMWEMLQPIPPTRGPDLRRARTTLVYQALRSTQPPDFDAIHYVRPHLADECQYLFRLDLRAPMLWTGLAAVDYAAWLLDEDMEPSCRFYRRLLQLFQAQDPQARLVLKNPGHALYAEALIRTLPEAHFVQTHRDPARTLPSLCKLAFTTQRSVTRGVDPAAVVRTLLEQQAAMAERTLVLDTTDLGSRVLHVRYLDLVADPLGTVQRIHRHAGLPWTPVEQEPIRTHLERSRGETKGKRNRYSLEEYGLEPVRVAAAMGDYAQFWR